MREKLIELHRQFFGASEEMTNAKSDQELMIDLFEIMLNAMQEKEILY